MLGTIVNIITVVLGTAIGCILHHGLPKKIQDILMTAVGLCTMMIGIASGIESDNLVLLIVSVALGAVIGRWIGIEEKLDAVGKRIENRFSNGNGSNKIAKGFVTATLIYCVGAMTILGSIQSGLTNNHEILFTKSILDGIVSVVLASTLGFGVGLSAISILVIQGSITVLASFLQPLLTDVIMNEISAVGGVLILGIGFNLLNIKKIPVGDMVPAILIPPVYYLLMDLVKSFF